MREKTFNTSRAKLIVKKLNNTLSPDEQTRLDELLKQPHFKTVYERLTDPQYLKEKRLIMQEFEDDPEYLQWLLKQGRPGMFRRILEFLRGLNKFLPQIK